MISSRADIRTDSDDVFFQPEKNGVCSESLRASTPLPYLIECLRKRNDETARVRGSLVERATPDWAGV